MWYFFRCLSFSLLLPRLGVGLWIAALMVQYRDFRFIVPFLVQFGLYLVTGRNEQHGGS